MIIETGQACRLLTFRVDGFSVGRFVVLDDVHSSDLISLVNSEELDGLEETEDGDTADDVPGEDGPGPGRVPDEHHEGRVAAGIYQAWRWCTVLYCTELYCVVKC